MPKEGLTEIVCVLDRSGSMESIIDDAIGGFNTFLKSQQELDIGEAKMTIALFDDRYDLVCESKDIKEVEKFTKKSYVPRGGTALFDAIGKTIKSQGEIYDNRLEHLKPEKVIFVILTDGQENRSTEYSADAVKKLVEEQKNNWNWEFIFLSSDISAFEQGAMFGIHHTSRFAKGGDAAVHAYACIADAVVSYRSSGCVGESKKEIV